MRSLFVIALLSPLPLLAAPPIIDAINPQSVNENQDLTVAISSADPDGDAITLSTSALPPNAIFNDQGNGDGFLQFAPDFTQAGTFDITITATDSTASASSLVVTITVVNVNRAPIITGDAALSGNVGDTLTAAFGALDPDGDTVTFSGQNLPGNMTVTNTSNTSGLVTFTPTADDAGRTTVSINADDGTQISAIPLLVDITPLPVEDCSVHPSPNSSSNAFWLLLLSALLLRRRK